MSPAARAMTIIERKANRALARRTRERAAALRAIAAADAAVLDGSAAAAAAAAAGQQGSDEAPRTPGASAAALARRRRYVFHCDRSRGGVWHCVPLGAELTTTCRIEDDLPLVLSREPSPILFAHVDQQEVLAR